MLSNEKKILLITVFITGFLILAILFLITFKLGQKSIEKKTPQSFKPTAPREKNDLENAPVDPQEVFARGGTVKEIGKDFILVESKFRPDFSNFAEQDIKVKLDAGTKFITVENGKESPASLANIKQGDKVVISSLTNIKNLPEFTADYVKIIYDK